jgi:hypothetical protein
LDFTGVDEYLRFYEHIDTTESARLLIAAAIRGEFNLMQTKHPVEFVIHDENDDQADAWNIIPQVARVQQVADLSAYHWAHGIVQVDPKTLVLILTRPTMWPEVPKKAPGEERGPTREFEWRGRTYSYPEGYGYTLAYTTFETEEQKAAAITALRREVKQWGKNNRLPAAGVRTEASLWGPQGAV